MTNLQRLEVEALEYAGLSSLPEAANSETPMWILGIAKVLTRENRYSYAIVRNKRSSSPAILKSFDSGSIARIVEVYPYKFLNSEYLLTFKTVGEARKFIVTAYNLPEEKVANLPKEKLLDIIFSYGVDRQLRDEKRAADAIERRERAKKERLEAEKDAKEINQNKDNNETDD